MKPLSSEAKSIQIGGQYEHFKGLSYKVIAVARHSETLEEINACNLEKNGSGRVC